MKTSKNAKTDEKHCKLLVRKEKSNTPRKNNTTRGAKSEGTRNRLRYFKTTKEILPTRRGRHTNNWIQMKQSNFEAKCRNEEYITEKAEKFENIQNS